MAFGRAANELEEDEVDDHPMMVVPALRQSLLSPTLTQHPGETPPDKEEQAGDCEYAISFLCFHLDANNTAFHGLAVSASINLGQVNKQLKGLDIEKTGGKKATTSGGNTTSGTRTLPHAATP